jgi:carboxylesterase type B
LQCLRDKTATEILNAQSNAILPFALLKFTPVVDLQGDIDQQPFLVLEKRDFLPLSILGGTVTADGRELANGLLVKNVPETPAEEQYQVTLTELFGEENVAMLQSLYPTVATDSPSEARVDQLGAMLTDYLFFCPLRNLSSLFALDAPVFLYQFNHVPSFGGQSNVCEGYVCNRAELPFVFGSIVPATPSSSEAELSMNLVRSWTNFVNSQDPNIGFQLSPDITFPIYNTSYDGLLVLNLTSMVKRDERASLCAVWDGLGLYPQPLDASLSSAHPSVSPSAHTDNAVSAQLLVLAVVLPLIACILTVALCLINRAYSTGSRRSVLPTLGFSNGQNSSLPLKHFVIEGDETDDEQYANNREL